MEYRFNQYRLNPQKKLLYRDNELIEAEPRVVALLHLLLRRYPETVSRRELLETLWPRQEVSDWSLSQLIRRSRQLLDDDSRNPTYIKTMHGVGVRFLVDPVLTETPSPSSLPATDPAHRKRKRWLWGLPALLLLSLALFGWLKQQQRPALGNPLADLEGYPYTVALLPLENNSANPAYSWVELGLMDMLGQMLGESAGINTLDTNKVLAFLKNNPLPENLSDPHKLKKAFDSICPALGCQILLSARLDEVSDGAHLSYQLATAKGLHPLRVITANTVLEAGSGVAREITRWVDPARPWIVDTAVSYSADKAANRAYAMGSQELFNGEPKAAAQYLRIALGIDPEFLWAKVRLADALYRLNDLDTSQQLITRLLSTEDLPADIYFQTLRVRSNLLYAQGKLAESRNLSDQLLKLARASGDLIAQAAELMNIGTSYQASGDNDRALSYLLSAEQLYRQAKFRPGIGKVLFNIGNVHTGANNYRKAEPYYRQAELIFQQLGNRQLIAMVGFQQANLLKVTGRLEQARKKLETLIPVFEKLGDTEGAALAQVDMARIDILRGKTEAGIRYLENLLPVLREKELGYVEYQAHNYLAAAYLDKHQPSAAKTHIQTGTEFQATDPGIALLPARLAFEEQKYAKAREIALQVREKTGSAWKPEHQMLLEKIASASAQQTTGL
ncbi:MAG TPA: tetratricopeptide repeat protein [Thiolapillus brandeum]|uniref:Tetratricopeptide repeat protein n=1 Tax=Thiolapillus brandeum TaxID=1076588 RepID=A0A831WF09_9GAMM|nr:tetratricopeptide repeat protein [Thiolapillus brandeum]